MEPESDSDINRNWCGRHWNQSWAKGLEKKKTREDHPNDSIVEIGKNTMRPEDSRSLAVTQTPVENHQLTLVRKILGPCKRTRIVV